MKSYLQANRKREQCVLVGGKKDKILRLSLRARYSGLIFWFIFCLSACMGQLPAHDRPAESFDRTYRILVTNDDGIHSEGIRVLAMAVADIAEVVIVAPEKNESGASQASRAHAVKPTLSQVDMGNSIAAYAFNSTPADCVAIATKLFGADKPFDLVISGVNAGRNLGSSFLYSGTIGAAFEALVNGIPAIAVSQDTRRESFDLSVAFAVQVIRSILHQPMLEGELLSINVPAGDIRGVAALPADLQPYNVEVERMSDESGVYYRHFILPLEQPYDGYDIQSFRNGYITVTPLKLDRNAYGSLDELAQRSFVREWPGGEN